MSGLDIFLLVNVVAVVLVQMLVVYLRKKKNRFFVAFLPNVGLLIVGLIFSVVGYLIALSETSSWADLGFLILLMVTVITTLISSFVSLLLLIFIKPKPKA